MLERLRLADAAERMGKRLFGDAQDALGFATVETNEIS